MVADGTGWTWRVARPEAFNVTNGEVISDRRFRIDFGILRRHLLEF
jgi:hypothetical protein